MVELLIEDKRSLKICTTAEEPGKSDGREGKAIGGSGRKREEAIKKHQKYENIYSGCAKKDSEIISLYFWPGAANFPVSHFAQFFLCATTATHVCNVYVQQV